MKNNYHITCYRDLEREERLVMDRIKIQEQEIKAQFKKLPQELLITAINKTISSFTGGNILASGGKILQSVISYFIKNSMDENSEPGKMVENLVIKVLDKLFHKTKG
jgi:predicted ATP-grasp superfamily ATP-dependent carboligase